MNLLDKETTDSKTEKNARGLISLSLPSGFKTVNSVEVPQYVKVTRIRSHISCSLDEERREFVLQSEVHTGEISHSENTKYNYNELRHVCES